MDLRALQLKLSTPFTWMHSCKFNPCCMNQILKLFLDGVVFRKTTDCVIELLDGKQISRYINHHLSFHFFLQIDFSTYTNKKLCKILHNIIV